MFYVTKINMTSISKNHNIISAVILSYLLYVELYPLINFLNKYNKQCGCFRQCLDRTTVSWCFSSLFINISFLIKGYMRRIRPKTKNVIILFHLGQLFLGIIHLYREILKKICFIFILCALLFIYDIHIEQIWFKL